MTKTVEFYYDFGSPTSYLASTQLPLIAERTGGEVIHKPALLGGIFKLTGNRAPITVPAKGEWMAKDMARFAKRYGVPFKMNPHFPMKTVSLMRGVLVAMREGYYDAYYDRMWQAMWVDGRNPNDPEEMRNLIEGIGIDPEAFAAGIQDPSIKQELIDRTNEAVERGLFGMPTMFVGDEMHFGQDRLDFVEEALAWH